MDKWEEEFESEIYASWTTTGTTQVYFTEMNSLVDLSKKYLEMNSNKENKVKVKIKARKGAILIERID